MPSQSWIITTAVGTGERGFAGDGGPGKDALLNGPFDVGFDMDGNLYFSDTFNHRIDPPDAMVEGVGEIEIAVHVEADIERPVQEGVFARPAIPGKAPLAGADCRRDDPGLTWHERPLLVEVSDLSIAFRAGDRRCKLSRIPRTSDAMPSPRISTLHSFPAAVLLAAMLLGPAAGNEWRVE